MRIGRRTFLKLAGILSAWAYALRPTRALAEQSAVSIHRATRNTLLGAIGAGLREMRAALPPFKAYPGKDRIRLGPKPATTEGAPLVEVIERAYASAEEKPAPPAPASTPQSDAGPAPGVDGASTAPPASPAPAPNADEARAPPPASPAPRVLTLDVLARLLYFTNGDTEANDADPYRLRAAPSAGMLYAGELYVVALAVRDLDRGVYYYDVGGHQLALVRGNAEMPAFASAFEDSTTATNAAALVIVTNVFARYEQRYSNRGYRYALVDTGHIGENLRLAATVAGVAHRDVSRFADAQLNALLGIDGSDEAVCAVHVLGESAATPSGAPSLRRRFVEKVATGAPPTADSDPTVRYHDATMLVVGEPRLPRDESGEETTGSAEKPPASSKPAIALSSPSVPPTAAAEACIVSRRSPRAFAPRSISAAQLGFVTRAAYPVAAARRSLGLELQLVVHRVDGVDAGLYRFVPDKQSFEIVRVDDFTESLPRVCLGQSKAGDAAVGFVMVGRIRAAAAAHGERAYRDLLIEAGEIGERVYLAAEAVGLSARNLAAFIDEDLNSLLGLDGADVAVVHLTMVGHGA